MLELIPQPSSGKSGVTPPIQDQNPEISMLFQHMELNTKTTGVKMVYLRGEKRGAGKLCRNISFCNAETKLTILGRFSCDPFQQPQALHTQQLIKALDTL